MNSERLENLKKLNPQVGKSLRKKFNKKKNTQLEEFNNIKKEFGFIPYNEISYITLYFENEYWVLHNRSTLSGNLKYKCFVIDEYDKTVMLYDEKNKDINMFNPNNEKKEENKYSKDIRNKINKLNLSKLSCLSLEFIKGSTTMEFTKNNKCVEVYKLNDKNIYIIFSEIEIKKKNKEEEINYSEVLEKLRKGKLVNEQTGDVIEEYITDPNLDKLIEKDMEQEIDFQINRLNDKNEINKILETLKKN